MVTTLAKSAVQDGRIPTCLHSQRQKQECLVSSIVHVFVVRMAGPSHTTGNALPPPFPYRRPHIAGLQFLCAGRS